MASVKDIMNCIGVDTSEPVSMLFHLFGFFRGRVPVDPCSSDPGEVSLLSHLNSLQGKHIHLNIIRVGIAPGRGCRAQRFLPLDAIHLANGIKSTFQMTEFNPYRNWKWVRDMPAGPAGSMLVEKLFMRWAMGNGCGA